MDDLGVPLFSETPICIYLYCMYVICIEETSPPTCTPETMGRFGEHWTHRSQDRVRCYTDWFDT